MMRNSTREPWSHRREGVVTSRHQGYVVRGSFRGVGLARGVEQQGGSQHSAGTAPAASCRERGPASAAQVPHLREVAHPGLPRHRADAEEAHYGVVA